MRILAESSIFTAIGALITGIVRRVNEVLDPDAASAIPPLTPKAIEGYAYGGATDNEIAARFQVEPELLRQRFGEVLATTRAARNFALRKFQFELAQKGNGPMLIWLGRNELGQSLNPATPGEPEPELDEKAG